MKLESLKINGFRGIPELKIETKGDNIAVVGPNGSGKSTIIDAIDFLLTGKLKRLSGIGTSDIHLKEHYPHVDIDIEDSWVEGTFSYGEDETITIKREVEKRNNLSTDKDVPIELERFISAANNGQHFLSRREILKIITSKKGDRADEISSLMDIKKIDNIRKELKGVKGRIKNELDQYKRQVDNYWSRLSELFDNKLDSKEELLIEVNKVREELEGDPLDGIRFGREFNRGIEKPVDKASASPIQFRSTKDLLETTNKWIEEGSKEFIKSYKILEDSVYKIKEEENALKELDTLSLIEKGKNLLDEYSGRCPLCLKDWNSVELKEFLEEREFKAKEIKKKKKDIEKIKDTLLERITHIKTAIHSLIEILEEGDFKTNEYERLNRILIELEEELKEESLLKIPLKDVDIKEQIASDELEEHIKEMLKTSKKLPELDKIQDKWDLLEQSYRDYIQLEKSINKMKENNDKYNEMVEIYESFLEARDEILRETYDEVAEKFEEFYELIHREEDDFSPKIDPTEAGLDLKVGFHGRDKHPPHALHSEGHQDSMGLCLYLALCDHFQSDNLPLIMLDDVIMSIDSFHRRPLAKMIADEISPEYQLVITTHDELWFRYLKSEGVVKSKNSIYFTGWTIENGPLQLAKLESDWNRIEELLEEGDVPSAAHNLRRTSEWFLREICHNLGARVRFKADGVYNAGDFLGPAKKKYKDLLKQTKSTEQSWGNDISHLNELSEKRKLVYREMGNLESEINPNVHFNADQWSSYSKEEFQQVLSAYQDFYDLYWCDNCGSFIKILEEGNNPVAVKCRCGKKAEWNLEKNKDET